MTILSRHNRASFETTKRVLAEIVNEGLVHAKLEITTSEGPQILCLLSTLNPEGESLVKVAIKPGTIIEMRDDRVVSVVRPGSLQPPVILADTNHEEFDPGTLFKVLSTSFGDVASGTVLDEIVRELRNSAANQEKWLEIGQDQPLLNLKDRSAHWELTAEDIPGMLKPTLAFISVPRTDLRVTGHFEQELQPLLERLEIPGITSDRVIVPCLSQQLSSIHQRFPNATVLKLIEDCADAQASMRTLTLRPDGPVQSELLEKLLPNDLWGFREVAGVTGSQEDFNDARHLSCILRDSLETRARENDETLIIAAALAQKPSGDGLLFELVLPPLVQYGIGLEGHGQNLVARVCRRTGQIKGFAVRDFGGVRMHVPTLRNHGVRFDSLPPGAATLTDDLQNVWSKVHHSLLQNHVGLLLGALGLENHGGWAITLEILSTVLASEKGSPGETLFEYFTKDTMPFKCFLRMRMESKYRDYIEREVPNSLLMDTPRWESLLDTYRPSLHAT
ncbi:hypothetical protein PENNAL_c0047G00432 [Penicillium nalgiovense]|uniref:Aerobactin siderophore biosynthesis IucA/IucC-like C-terminal domain-containing protein n=2 Tax=Penicillium nalgiovense TaxID=60175 RepID=A0A1V6XYE7_PENNA|nr:hypothetical protein PENNAL_c0047G00432 [Penicillium nalgiovense]